MSPVRNVSCREVQGNNLLWLGEIEASCPESVPIPQGRDRCHLCCEALAKAKPPHRINLASPPLLELFLLHGLGLVCRVYSLHLSFWPLTLSYSSLYPSLASTKQLLNLWRSIEFSFATWIESTFPMYLGPSQKESLDPVKQGVEGQTRWENHDTLLCCLRRGF